MQFDLSGAELFLTYLKGQAAFQEVLDHPAYQVVGQHIRMFSEDYPEGRGGSRTAPTGIQEMGGSRSAPTGLSEGDIQKALQGKRSGFLGLQDLNDRLPRIITFLEFLQKNANGWSDTIQTSLSEIFPQENLNIPIYPIIGYDMGIGLNGAVCMNINCGSYLAEPEEFLFYAIHECTHVIYERHHSIPPFSKVYSAGEWASYFNLWFQNEGYAVYTPLKLRQERGALGERDYKVLFNPVELEKCRRKMLKLIDRFNWDQAISRRAYMRMCFGPGRLTYRMGCELIRRIEREGGMEAVRRAFYLDGNEFIHSYRYLLV